jgi:hypothetical protein
MTTKALQAVIANLSERLGIVERKIGASQKKLSPEDRKRIQDETFGSIDKKRAKEMLTFLNKSRNSWR